MNALLTSYHLTRVEARDSQQRSETAVAPANTKAVLCKNADFSELLDEKSRMKVLKATQIAKTYETQMGDMRLNTSAAGREQRNAPMNPIVYSWQKTSIVSVSNASLGLSRCVIMYQYAERNQRQFWKRQFISNDQNIQHRGPRLWFVSIGPLAASAPTATSKQE
ncbi:MAG: hypothetical protein EZS28_008538 [Streblomastix strix]|uniref:Uncharacterized protein n=1 Tax=Streblomastix strix TaxID=222440 RepID=A0A5J4WM75_9EUKA|nr:MAG: hypothetical protein EZS28_008538 [Streblomastix strix]